jgi:DNA-binding IclR family transcriptional regulator
MAKTLVRGLELIEELGLYGPMTISDLSRRSGVHVSIVSRTVAALEPEGWLIRVDGKVAAGPRCALLGLISPAGKTVRRAETLVRVMAAVSGVATAASGLIGRDVMILASSSAAASELPEWFSSRVPVYVMAAGRAIAAELPTGRLDTILPGGGFPDAAKVLSPLAGSAPIPDFLASAGPGDQPYGSIPRSRADLEAEIATIRETGFARGHGELHPAIHCIAAPWPTPELPASLACIGSPKRSRPTATRSRLACGPRPGLARAPRTSSMSRHGPGSECDGRRRPPRAARSRAGMNSRSRETGAPSVFATATLI